MTEEVRVTSSSGGEKGKKIERFDLLPVEALEELARIYEFGSRKYADHNYRKGYDWSLSYASLQRHANLWWKGEDLDEESGLSHIMHAAWHCFALYMFLLEHPEFDDRLSTIRKQTVKEKPAHQVALEQQVAELKARIWELENPNTHPETGETVEELRRGIVSHPDFADLLKVKLAGEEVVYDRPDQHKEKIGGYYPHSNDDQTDPRPIAVDDCCHNCRFGCLQDKENGFNNSPMRNHD